MGASFGTKTRRRRQGLGMTQLDLAEKTGLSEAAERSYELGGRNPKDAHRRAIAEELGASANYLRKHDGCRESGIVHFIIEMEAYVMLPRTLAIPALMGNNAPSWTITFKQRIRSTCDSSPRHRHAQHIGAAWSGIYKDRLHKEALFCSEHRRCRYYEMTNYGSPLALANGRMLQCSMRMNGMRGTFE